MKNILKATILFLILFSIYSFNNSAKYKKIRNGKIAPEIVLPMTSGDTVRLSDYRGSIVLIDFWASWCKGCREFGPKLVKIQSRYSDCSFKGGEKGFHVLSVNLDTDRNRWLNAIEKDSIYSFINVSDLLGMNSEVAIQYGIGGLPFGYLIDGNGIVIEKGAEMFAKLEELAIENK